MRYLSALLRHCINAFDTNEVERWVVEIGALHDEIPTLLERPRDYVGHFKAVYQMIKDWLPNMPVGVIGCWQLSDIDTEYIDASRILFGSTGILSSGEGISYDNTYTVFGDAAAKDIVVSLNGLQFGRYKVITTTLSRESGSLFDEWLRCGIIDELQLQDIYDRQRPGAGTDRGKKQHFGIS